MALEELLVVKFQSTRASLKGVCTINVILPQKINFILQKFKCITCDYTCEIYSELVEHSDKYYYSHRRALNKDHEKYILDEFQQLDEDGFLIHRKLDW